MKIACVLIGLALALTGLGFASSAAAGSSSVFTWGSDRYAQLGPPGPWAPGADVTISSPGPLEFSPDPAGQIVAVAAGEGHSLALMADGTVRAWGKGEEGQLGDGTRSTSKSPVQVQKAGGQPLDKAVAIAAGFRHNLAVVDPDGDGGGEVWAWGSNACGQLGDPVAGAPPPGSLIGTSVPRLPAAAVQAVKVSGVPAVKAVAAGRGHSLALAVDGTLWAWGDNSVGQLGLGAGAPDNAATSGCDPAVGGVGVGAPSKVAITDPVVTVAAGSNHSLAVTSGGAVLAWGDNCSGQIGLPVDGQNAPSPARGIPLPVAGLPAGDGIKITRVSGGSSHSLALVVRAGSGEVWAWGQVDRLGAGNIQGTGGACALGGLVTFFGATKIQAKPVQVVAASDNSVLKDIRDISAGGSHSLAVGSSAAAYSWGANNRNQLGFAKPPASDEEPPCPSPPALCIANSLKAEEVSALGKVLSVAAGGLHNVAIAQSEGQGPVQPSPSAPVPPSPPADPVKEIVDEASEPPDEPAVPVGRPPAGTEPGIKAPPGPGGAVLVTGHALDAHPDNFLGSTSGIGFLKLAISFVTPEKAAPRILYVPGDMAGLDDQTPPAMIDTGLVMNCDQTTSPPGCFDAARSEKNRSQQRNLPEDRAYPYATKDLDNVEFGNYDALVVGASLLAQEMDALVERQQEIMAFVNGGAGLLVNMQIAPDTCVGTAPPDPFGEFQQGYNQRRACELWKSQPPGWDGVRFMTFLRDRFIHPSPTVFRRQGYGTDAEIEATGGAAVTTEGRALGFSDSDENPRDNHKWFAGTCGFEVIDALKDGRAVTMATRRPIPPPALFCGEAPDKEISEGSSGFREMSFEVAAADRRWAREAQQDLADGPVTLSYTTADGTAGGASDCSSAAEPGAADYVSATGNVTFQPGESAPKPIIVKVCGDVVPEADEQFRLAFSHPEDPNISFSAIGTILNDDFGGASEEGASASEGGAFVKNTSDLDFLPAQTSSSAARVFAPAPAIAPAAAVPAPALATELASAQATSQASSHAQMYVPQVGMGFEKDKERQVETAGLDPADVLPHEYLAAARARGGPGLAIALMTLAFAGALAVGRRLSLRPGPGANVETVRGAPHDEEDDWFWLRRLHDQR